MANTKPSALGLAETRFAAALAGRQTDRPPFWFMRQAGRYLPEYQEIRAKVPDFLALCYTPELAARVTMQPIERFGMDAAILFSDILVVPHGLGVGVRFVEGEGPRLDPVRGAADLSRLRPEAVAPVVAPVMETVRLVRRALDPKVALIGFAGAPWTVATYMVDGGSSRDFAATKAWAYGDVESFSRLIDMLVEATVSYLDRQIEAGADVVQLFDTWAGALSPSQFDRWVIGPARRIVDGVRMRHPNVPVIGFPRGAGSLYRRYAKETGVNCVGIDTTVDPSWAAQMLQPMATVQGNLDPMALVAGGAAMRAEAERIFAALGKGPFIFNLGHGIVPQTPPAHVAELSALIRDWRA
ncbi:MAG: uroporphyrinogen decarboxylase [Alphaproteobacteria bacterium]